MLLDKLLQLPNPAGNLGILHRFSTQLDQHGICLEDATDLVEIATNTQLYYGSHKEFFAMHYALYALGGLQYAEACPKIIEQVNRIKADEDEWINSYVFVFELMGEKAIPYLLQACKNVSLESMFILTESLGKLVSEFPALREQVLLAFDALLARVECCAIKSDALFSGETSLLMGWLDMKAVERIDVIRELDRQNKFNKSYCGHIEDIEYELGLRNVKPS